MIIDDAPLSFVLFSLYTANNFGIMYSRKRISQNLSFMIFCQELQDPERNYENQIWTEAPKDVIMKKKKLHTLDSNSGTLHHQQVFCHWIIEARYHRFPQINISSIQNYQGLSFLPVTFNRWAYLFPQLGSSHQQLCGNWLCWSNVKILIADAGVPGSKFNIFSCWHPWETRFKSGFHSSFWDFICGIWNWGMASSFWNHVIQISIRQVHFQHIYTQLWIVKIFSENFYFL